MKPLTSIFRLIPPTSILAIFAAVAPVSGQTTATTDPVGFITLSVLGGGSVASPTLSLVSPTLTQPILWQGVISGISGSVITVAGAPWTANQFNGAAGSHYVEITSTATPALSGTLADVTATTATTISTFPTTGAAIGDTIKIRRDVTIADLLGVTNSAGLLPSNTDASTADELLIYNGAAFASYFYYNGPGLPAGWYNSNTFDPAGSVSIAPNEAVVIKRKAGGAVNVVVTGAVKTGNTLIPILDGLNVLGTASAKGLTLALSGLFTGNNSTGVKPSAADASTADEIILYGATGQNSFFYYNGPGLPAGWYNSTTFDDATNTVIAPGTAFVLKRKSGVAFNWALPSPNSF